MDCDCAKSCECRTLEFDIGAWDPCDQHSRNARKLRMHGVIRSCASYTVTRNDVGNALAYRDHRSSTAVAQPKGLIESAAHRRHCGNEAISPDFPHDLSREVWPGLRFLDEVLRR